MNFNKIRNSIFVIAVVLLVFGTSCKTEDSSNKVYMSTSFHEPATDGLRYLYSNDGINWEDLDTTFLAPKVGPSKLMRDPSMVLGPDGTYHLVWTTGWRGDLGFGYAYSKDLIHWSEQEFIPIMEYDTATVNVWAPELYYDDEGEQFIIIWASTIPYQFPKGIEDEKNNHRMYATTTKDFKTFSKAKLFLDPGFSVIDAVIVKRASKDYVLVLKDNTRPNRNLKVAFGDNPLGPWKNVSDSFSGNFVEGPTVIKLEDAWYIFSDVYKEYRYGVIKTSDFIHFTDVSDEFSIPKGHKHGTIFSSTQEVLDGVKKDAAEKMAGAK